MPGRPDPATVLRRSPLLRRASRAVAARRFLPDWTSLQIPHDTRGTRVLLASLVGGSVQAAQVERLLAAALSARGHRVDAVLCDGDLPACIECSLPVLSAEQMARHGPERAACPGCAATGERALHATGAKVHPLGRWITPEDQRQAQAWAAELSPEGLAAARWHGVPVGEHALAGALRFFASATLPTHPSADAIARRYLSAAVTTARAAERWMDDLEPDVVLVQHGIYVPQGVVLDVARQRRVRVVSWSTAYRRGCLLLAHGDTYHRTMPAEGPSTWADAPWDDGRRLWTERYLQARRTGSQDWITFGASKATAVADPLIGEERPLVLVLPNVSWDAQIHIQGRAFATQTEWILETVRWASTRPDLAVVVRAHPAETAGYLPSHDRVGDAIAAAFPALPANVTVIGPDSTDSTYDLIEQANCVIVHATKTAVEAAARGVPVITTAEAWIRGKGLSVDVDSREAYRTALDALPLPEGLSPEQRDQALRYAHHLFRRRMIPLRALVPLDRQGPGQPLFTASVASRADLLPGADPGLDVICRGITEGTPFALDEDVDG